MVGQAPVELDEIERAGWWGFLVGPVLDGGVAAAADAGGSVRRRGRAAGFEKHGVVPAVAEVVAVGQAGAGAGQGGGQAELVGVGAAVEVVEGIGVVHAVDGEDVQVVAVPFEQDLDDLVELGEGGGGAQPHAAPDRRPEPVEVDPQLEHVGVGPGDPGSGRPVELGSCPDPERRDGAGRRVDRAALGEQFGRAGFREQTPTERVRDGHLLAQRQRSSTPSRASPKYGSCSPGAVASTSRAAVQTIAAPRRPGSSDSARRTAATPCRHWSIASAVVVTARASRCPTVRSPAPWAAVQARCSAGTCAALTTRPGSGSPVAAHAAGMSARRSTAFAVTGRPAPTKAATARARVSNTQCGPPRPQSR